MRIEENYLVIRPFQEDDIKDLYALLSDAEVMKYLEEPYDYAKTERFLKESALGTNPLIYAVEDNHQFVGHVIYHPIDESAYELGWVLKKECWHQGYASRLTQILIEYSKGKTRELLIECIPEQSMSKKIAEKFGFVYQGIQNGLEQYVLRLEK